MSEMPDGWSVDVDGEKVVVKRHDPELSDWEHGRRDGVDHNTVAAVRTRLERDGELPHVDRREDSMGRCVRGYRSA